MMENRVTGRVMSNAEYIERLKAKYPDGRIILNAYLPPPIGEIQSFAGLPMRVVRWVPIDEAREDFEIDHDDGDAFDADMFYFEVEVAD
jgi:hypothetical protein